jgi:hypothetical protein
LDNLRGNWPIVFQKQKVDWVGCNLSLDRAMAIPIDRLGQKRYYLLV